MSSPVTWSSIANLTAKSIERIGRPAPSPDTSLQLSPLHLPYSPSQIRVELEQLGCSDRTMNTLGHAFRVAVEELIVASQSIFTRTMQGTAPTLEQESFAVYEHALRGRYECDFLASIASYRTDMLEEVRRYQARLPKEIMARHGTGYTTTITDILSAVFHQKDKISMAEKRRLASVTGLTENQVAVWVRLSSLCSR